MSQCATVVGASAPDRLARLIQKRVFGDRVKKDRQGLSALRRFNELRICEAYMNGSLDVQGGHAGLRQSAPRSA